MSQVIDCGLDEWNTFSGRNSLAYMFRVICAHLACLVLRVT